MGAGSRRLGKSNTAVRMKLPMVASLLALSRSIEGWRKLYHVESTGLARLQPQILRPKVQVSIRRLIPGGRVSLGHPERAPMSLSSIENRCASQIGLRCSHFSMAERFAESPDVPATLNPVRCKLVAEQVGMNMGLDSRPASKLGNLPERIPSVQSPASECREDKP